MTSFLTGVLTAVVLSGATYLALNEFSQTSIERVDNPSVNLGGVDQDFSPVADTNREGIAGRDDD